ncbi:hypothetical protein R6Q57_010477 [Mikania cordata]
MLAIKYSHEEDEDKDNNKKKIKNISLCYKKEIGTTTWQFCFRTCPYHSRDNQKKEDENGINHRGHQPQRTSPRKSEGIFLFFSETMRRRGKHQRTRNLAPHTFGEGINRRDFFSWDISSYLLRRGFTLHKVLFQMTTTIAIEDVHREVKILRALTGHNNLINFYDAYEDHNYVHLVMELCEGGVLLDRILSRGGKYTECDAKGVLIQMLTVIAFCHLQGVVHRDLKPENFLFASKDNDSELKAIDFGLSDFVSPEKELDDIVGSAYYVAPEVLQRSYSTEADVWSIGVIAYVLLCGNRPFWGRTESGIFRSVLKNEPNFDEALWSDLSFEAKDFVKTLLNKDPRKRLTAAQALCHPWLRNGNEVKTPLDISILKFVKRYICSSNLRKAALRALSKTLIFDELVYLKEQFSLLEPTKNGFISIESLSTVLMKYTTDAMKDSGVHDFLESVYRLQYRKMDFQEFCAATIRVDQLEGLDRWD